MGPWLVVWTMVRHCIGKNVVVLGVMLAGCGACMNIAPVCACVTVGWAKARMFIIVMVLTLKGKFTLKSKSDMLLGKIS